MFVSINYRLGLLGFLSSSELSEEAAQYGEVGWANQGLHDQRLALLWVRQLFHEVHHAMQFPMLTIIYRSEITSTFLAVMAPT